MSRLKPLLGAALMAMCISAGRMVETILCCLIAIRLAKWLHIL